MAILWIDDIRPINEEFAQKSNIRIWATTSEAALTVLKDWNITIESISFDHDLGGDDTSMPVARWLEYQAYYGNVSPIEWFIHSANPVGRVNLEATLKKADEYWIKK